MVKRERKKIRVSFGLSRDTLGTSKEIRSREKWSGLGVKCGLKSHDHSALETLGVEASTQRVMCRLGQGAPSCKR